ALDLICTIRGRWLKCRRHADFYLTRTPHDPWRLAMTTQKGRSRMRLVRGIGAVMLALCASNLAGNPAAADFCSEQNDHRRKDCQRFFDMGEDELGSRCWDQYYEAVYACRLQRQVSQPDPRPNWVCPRGYVP